MNYTIILWSVVTMLFCGSNSVYAQSKSSSAQMKSSLFDTSDYIFQGKIVAGEKNELSMDLENSTVQNVRVEKVISCSDGHENFQGQNVQVVFNEKARYERGKSYVFYTKTWLFGKTLTVVANDVRAEFKIEDIRKQAITYKEVLQNEKIQERLKRAELVITGTVENIKKTDVSPRTTESEHNPNWYVATIQVNSVLKGRQTAKKVSVFFSGSRDIHWYKAPKLRAEQKGIFILNRKEEFPETKGNFVLSKADEYYPASQESIIKQLLKN